MGMFFKKILRTAAFTGVIAAVAGTAALVRNRRLFFVTGVTTGESPDYPDLRAHIYFGSMEGVASAAAEAIGALKSWRLIGTYDSGKKIVGEAESAFGSFLSDIVVTLQPLGSRHIRAIIQSKSRPGSGRGDLGENARFIRELQSAMDGRLVGG